MVGILVRVVRLLTRGNRETSRGPGYAAFVIKMGNQALLNSAGNRELDRFYQRFSIIHRNPSLNVTFMEEKKTGHEFMLRELVTNDEFQKRRIEALVREKRISRNKYLPRLEDHFFERDKAYCSSQFRAFLLFESSYKDLREEMLERRINKSRFREEELLSVIESGVMGLRYLRDIQQPHQCVSSSSILISRDGLMMLTDPWLNPDMLQQCNHVYSSPEQLEASSSIQPLKVDWFASDLFSLGVVVLEAYHLEFMDDLYTKNGRSLNVAMLQNRVAVIRQQNIRRYVEQLLGTPQIRLTVAEEIAYQAGRPALARSGSQPSIQYPRFESNLLREQNERDLKRVLTPDHLRNHGTHIQSRPIAHSSIAPNAIIQQQQVQYGFKNSNQPPANLISINKPVPVPLLVDQQQVKHTHNLSLGAQTTTNLNLQKSRGGFKLNPIPMPVNTPNKSYVRQERQPEPPTERPIQLMTSRYEIRHLATEPNIVKQSPPHFMGDPTKGGIHSLSFLKKNQSVTQVASPIIEPTPVPSGESPTVATFMNIRNRTNRSATLNSVTSTNTTKNNSSSVMTSATSEPVVPPNNTQHLSFLNSKQVATSAPDNPSFIKKVPPPIIPVLSSYHHANKQLPRLNSPIHKVYDMQQPTAVANSASSSRMTSASRLHQLLSSPINPADLDLFTKPELLESISALTEKHSPQKQHQQLNYSKQYTERVETYQTLSSPSPSANDFINNFVDRDNRYVELYDSSPRQLVPQLVMPTSAFTNGGSHSDRTNDYDPASRYRFNQAAYGIEVTLRQVQTQRAMVGHQIAEEVRMLPKATEEKPIEETRATPEKEELKVVQQEYQEYRVEPQQYSVVANPSPEHMPIQEIEIPDAQLQKQHNQPYDTQQLGGALLSDQVIESDPALPPPPVIETHDTLNLHHTAEHEKPDSSHKLHEGDFNQLNSSNQQKYLLSYDMDNDSKIKSDSGHNTSNSSLINAMNMIEPPPPACLLQNSVQSNEHFKPMTPQHYSDDAPQIIPEAITPTRSRPQLQKYNSTIAEVSESDNSADVDDDGSQYIIEYYEIGSRYEGYKKNGMRNGKGKFYYQDGGFYEGEWKDNKMHGEGKLYYNESKLAYEGEWYLDEFHGHGKVYNDNPVLLEGPFNYKDFDGLDEYWVYYEGNLVTDTKEGFGRLKLSNGQLFEGEFRADRIQGNGKFYTIAGDIISGLWKDSKLVKQLG